MSVTVKTVDLAGMLTDLAKSASTDQTLPVLNAVQLFTADGFLVGVSTDRFVAAQATVEVVPDCDADLPVILLPMSSIKLLLPVIKGEKIGEATLTVEGDRLHVKTFVTEATVSLDVDSAFPKVASVMEAGDQADVGEISFGADVLGVAYAVAKRRKQALQMVFSKQGNWPKMHVRIGEHYRIVMMPLRSDDRVELPALRRPLDAPVSAAA